MTDANTRYCAIDFGTSNSGIALPSPAPRADPGLRLLALDPGQPTMPTAVFYLAESQGEEAPRLYGRAALAAYIDGVDGRLMRSMKSVLGSTLMEQRTDVGAGRSVPYRDVVAGFLRHLKQRAEAALSLPQGTRPGSQGATVTLDRVVLGRPVFFVDGDPVRDAKAQAELERAARAVGFSEVRFQFEPIAAALDFEAALSARGGRECLVLVADIGGGTSDFSLVRVGPGRGGRVDRRDDILANHGVHIAGTDFDRHLELESILPHCGYRGRGPAPGPGGRAGSGAGASPDAREVPSRVYFDLATWHLVNTVYSPARVAELRAMRDFYADRRHHQRLMTLVQQRLGHALLAQAEAAKIALAEGTRGEAGPAAMNAVSIDLSSIEPGLAASLDEAQALKALDAELQRIVDAALQTPRLGGVAAAAVDALYFTGGSTGFGLLTSRIAAALPNAEVVYGDRFASVAQGLGVHARRVFGDA